MRPRAAGPMLRAGYGALQALLEAGKVRLAHDPRDDPVISVEEERRRRALKAERGRDRPVGIEDAGVRPLAAVLEGGYELHTLPGLVRAALDGFESA